MKRVFSPRVLLPFMQSCRLLSHHPPGFGLKASVLSGGKKINGRKKRGVGVRPLTTGCQQLQQKSESRDPDQGANLYDFKEVLIPDVEKEFKGLETDFPCLARHDFIGQDPVYSQVLTGYKTYTSNQPFKLMYGGVLPEVTIAYETWGEVSPAKDNIIVLWTGLSASQHAKSHEDNPDPGWWEKFVGPGCAIDTDKFFVICANTLGSCFGTTGPSSINPQTGEPYATTFPMIGIEDMVEATFLLLDHLGIDKLYASVGSSLGGMLSLVASVLYPERVGKVVSISSCVRSHPVSIAMRYMQRKAIMLDPKWNKGYYYNTEEYPRMGVKIAREIATMTYRSGLEWEQRFGRAKVDEDATPSLCPHFLIENYLDYQGENYVSKIDANTILYLSKAMDLFDLSESYGTMDAALKLVQCPVLVIGAQTDILFPIWQQREMVEQLQKSGNDAVTYYELNSLYGHDTFLLDLNGVGTGVKGFLETDNKNKGRARKRKDKK